MRHVHVGRFRIPITSAWLVPALLTGGLVVVVSAAAAAAIETQTVGSFGKGLWWAISLVTTVGFVGEPPETVAGAVLSALLMVLGFLLLAMVSASLAALFVREEERPHDEREEDLARELLETLRRVEERLDVLERDLLGRVLPSEERTSDPGQG
ncbi:hypothetical protein EKO23_21155 [Nocardioides guangzhouensis]|uniref:Potassium channel domain-containing protein n=1 Tax=Nocardioides guangzhouensis TaxID=2497878 RepID=A0A4Q4Z4X0_9ACTN|nr:ion channel [Nocardioides guangzhouensis]RYP82692.1 hypothetical protein EKO23_21155 [Nocardioides guangzhouensis]